MAILKILQYGHPLLSERAREVDGVDDELRELFVSMGETMYDANGVGLAATQVGVMQRFFVVDVDQVRGDDGEEVEASRRLQVFVNPEIVWESEEDEPYEEGCLSIPGVNREVYRPSRIRVVARDENFERFELEADGLLARVIQHELDHLNGVLFVDHLSRVGRALVGGDLHRLKKETLGSMVDNEVYPVVVG